MDIVNLIIALVIGMEMVNTAIERVVDLVSPDYHPLAKTAKDMAAGAVFVLCHCQCDDWINYFYPKWF